MKHPQSSRHWILVALLTLGLGMLAGTANAQQCSFSNDFFCYCDGFNCQVLDWFNCWQCAPFFGSCNCITAAPPAGNISASPATPDCSSGLGTTTISWNTNIGSRNFVAVRVSVDGGSEVVFAGLRGGSAQASWISPGSNYTFSLYDNASSSFLGGNRLAQTIVHCQ
jgi:hypothetical protein